MLKSCFILLFSFYFLFGNENIQKGDQYFENKNYMEALKYYEKGYAHKEPQSLEKLLTVYITLGDRFFLYYKYDKAKFYYSKAVQLGSSLATARIATVYEKEAELYQRGKKFQEALEFYQKSYTLGNKKAVEKIEELKAIIKHQKNLKDDTRRVVTSQSALWTKSIGRLIIPTNKKVENNRSRVTNKQCSATLVNTQQNKSSKVLVTASHCLTDYDEKAGTIRFIIKSKEGKTIQKYAKIVFDSQFDPKDIHKKSDYAILILSSKIPLKEVAPMIVDPRSFEKLKKDYRYYFGSIAGFSSDIGDFGSQLTYDPKCELESFNNQYGKSSCSGFKGSSGGAVVLTLSNDKKTVEYFFVGVVSHFLNNRYQEIYFAPHHLFFETLQKSILKFNQ